MPSSYHSTQLQVLLVYRYCSSYTLQHTVFKYGQEESVTYHTMCDLSKAFDSVSHGLLLNKYYNLKIDQSWFHNYLSERTHCVRITNCTSDKLSVTYGVPQGSELGAILFSIYVNDLSSTFIDCQVIQYADDTQFIHTGDVNDSWSLMRRGEERIARAKLYFNRNGLLLNAKRLSVC